MRGIILKVNGMGEMNVIELNLNQDEWDDVELLENEIDCYNDENWQVLDYNKHNIDEAKKLLRLLEKGSN